jgi:hypothetical protein
MSRLPAFSRLLCASLVLFAAAPAPAQPDAFRAAAEGKRAPFHLTEADTRTLESDLRRLSKLPESSELWKQLREEILKGYIASANVSLFDALLHDDPARPAKDHYGRTALMYAAGAGNLEALSRLVTLKDKQRWVYRYHPDPKRAAEYLNACDDVTTATYGYTALMYAADRGKADCAAYLLNAGADPQVKCGFAQFTAAQLAEMHGHSGIAALIDKKLAEKTWYGEIVESLDFRLMLLGGVVALPAMFFGGRRFIRIVRRRWRETAPAE